MKHYNYKEIKALLDLVDDPDQEVYEQVAVRLIDYGQEVIPRLEQLWEKTLDGKVQSRIENLIHRVSFQDVQKDFYQWCRGSGDNLLEAALILSRYRYPDLDKAIVLSEIERVQKNIWLELNNYLSPLEKINVVNSIFYNFFKIRGEENVNKVADLFCLNYLLENRKGNSFSIGILYLIICQGLDIPMFGIGLPRQFILAYFDSLYHFTSPHANPVQNIQFFLDPVDGLVYTHNDVMVYLKKIQFPASDNFKKPLNNKEVIYKMLEEWENTYILHNERERSTEIRQLLNILKSNLPG